jgi:hypothetical protein
MQFESSPTRLVPLSRGLWTLVDAADYAAVRGYKWTAQLKSRGRTFYAHRTATKGLPKDQPLELHRFILDARNKWVAMITVNYRQRNLGCFTTPEAAARAYDAAARLEHGEFAWLNFPNG